MREFEEIRRNGRLIIMQEAIDGFSAEIHLYKWTGFVICSFGCGWEHVSVSPYKKHIIPSWEDMCQIKDIFWREDEWVCQFHPPTSEYVSNKDNCLHLWKPLTEKMPVPPSALVGLRKNQTMAELKKELKEKL